MSVLRVRHVRIPAELRNLRPLVAAPSQRAARRSADLLKRQLRQALREQDGVATGDLYESIDATVFESARLIQATAFSTLKYAIFYEEGRAPGRMPPVEKLEEWALLKGIPDDEAKSVAWAIATTIAEEGTKGKHVFRDVSKRVRPDILRLFDQEYSRQFPKRGRR